MNMDMPPIQEQRPDLFSLTDDEQVIISPQQKEITELLKSLSIAQLIKVSSKADQLKLERQNRAHDHPFVQQTTQEEEVNELITYARAIADGLNWDNEFKNSEQCVIDYIALGVRLN